MLPFVRGWLLAALAVGALALGGCTSPMEYLRNGFKVGPQYTTPPAPVAEQWIDSNDVRLHTQTDDLSTWWAVFDDPTLDSLMVDAYRQNLTLREAGFRILAARAQYGIAFGNFFPQLQTMNGSYQRRVIQQIYGQQWTYGFNMAWELDFWGRFRRAILSSEASLDASVFNYDDILVTLLGDVADAYVRIRTSQRRIQLLQNVIRVQQDVYNFITERLRAGFRGVTDLDKAQAESDLRQSQAQVEQLQIDLRQSENSLCTLLGIPAIDLSPRLNAAAKTGIPIPPDYAVIGVPADLLRRRPDVRRAERLAAAQAEQIGIATSDLYPAFTISGSIGWQNASLHKLVEPGSFTGAVGPSFQWNLLNYGRLVNNIRLQDATFNALVTNYQNTVVQASADVENGIVTFLRAQKRARLLSESVDAAYRALAVIVGQYEAGLAGVDFNRYAVILQSLVTQQDSWAQSQGQIGLGLIQVYRGLGGGWQIRLNPDVDQLRSLPPVDVPPAFGPQVPPAAEMISPPLPEVVVPPAEAAPNPPSAPSEELPGTPKSAVPEPKPS
jgi:NodT family efflux transporter outer membrane factor (OMF) lipoprotein